MLSVYINYPNPKISIHKNLSCAQIKKQNKDDQRLIKIDVDSISSELNKFTNGKYIFGSTPENNDMWLEIDFGDLLFEINVLEHIRKNMAKRHSPFNNIDIQIHC